MRKYSTCVLYWSIYLFMIALPSCAGRAEQKLEKPAQVEELKGSHKSTIQVVFALDATGSMSGLISAAKQKIWSIASGFTQADSATIEIGLVFYRDKGDEFITKRIAISTDIDNVYEQLMKIEANGGGDGPESVNQGLYEAVTMMEWKKDTTSFKTIFLVGDYPPHMDYKSDVKYLETCGIAREKDIVLNTILMGNNTETLRIWKEIADCGNGAFTAVGMDANNISVETPYDQEIFKVQEEIDKTRIYYGDMEQKSKKDIKLRQSGSLNKQMDASTAARRAEFNSTKSGKESFYGSNELINDYKNGKLNLETLKSEELPDEMLKMNATEKKKFVENSIAKRDSLELKMNDLVKKRQVAIDAELKKNGKGEESIDVKIFDNVKKQAEKKKIEVKGKAKL